MSKKDEDAVKDAFNKGQADKDWNSRPNKDTWTDKAARGKK